MLLPLVSPYTRDRLTCLAQDADLELTAIVESSSTALRPGWKPAEIPGVKMVVAESFRYLTTRIVGDLGYTAEMPRRISWRLPYLIARMRPDIVIPCNASQLALIYPICKLLGIKTGLLVEDTPHSTHSIGSIRKKIKRFLYQRADHCFAFSDDSVDFLRSFGIIERVSRTSWSLDLTAYDERLRALSSSSNLSKKRTVVYIGSLISRKGVGRLVDEWSELPIEQRAEARLLIVGGGPLEEAIRAQVRGYNMPEVELLGELSYDETRDIMCRADVCVMPTFEDLFSLVTIEAQASGCAVITTVFNGAREAVKNGETGWVVDPSQEGAIRQAILRALNASNLEQMKAGARENARLYDNTVVMSGFADDLRAINAA